MIHRLDVEEARDRIRGHIRTTPMLEVDPDVVGGRAFFTLELLQHTGTFKARGAFNRMLRAQQDGHLDRVAGIVIASGGNAGMANAYAASRLGVPATVFVPETAPAVKVAKLRAYGARVVQAGTEYAAAYAARSRRSHAPGRSTATRTTSPTSPRARAPWPSSWWSRCRAPSTRSWSRWAVATCWRESPRP